MRKLFWFYSFSFLVLTSPTGINFPFLLLSRGENSLDFFLITQEIQILTE